MTTPASLYFLKRISITYSGDAYSFQCGMQLLMWDEEWSYYWWVGQVNVVVSLVLKLLFLSYTLKNFLLGCYSVAVGKISVVVWAGDYRDVSGLGGLML